MTGEEIKADIKRVERYRDNAIDYWTGKLDALRKLLAEAEAAKPKLRSGDYGGYPKCLWVCHEDNQAYWNNGVICSEQPPSLVLGNLDDEIKALGEDRWDWRLDREGCFLSVGQGRGDSPITVNGQLVSLDEAKDLALALRQIIATAEPRGSK